MVSDTFSGTKRFLVDGCLGAGGMGVVHRARDLDRGEVVALKTMVRLEPDGLLRFKKEFRSLADISHPNVVQLYELFSEGDQWFFTMELIDGVDLLTWVRSSLQHFAVRDVARLRDAFGQLATGLLAIHGAGKLHRDVKPTNVIVTREGRVVLLDFGVASDLADRVGHGVDDSLAGTPAYMAPEQATFTRATPASDWYAVGVVLYEALTARLPFEGSAHAMMYAKQQGAPLPPSAHLEGVPEDLERLAMELLHPDPRSRPTGEQVLARLEGAHAAVGSSRGEPAFVGRAEQLEHLRAAFDASAEGLAVVTLYGRSGMGKSALASRFLSELAAKDDALVLSGRCYEREAVPFKAVDPIIDELRHWLASLPAGDAPTFLPPDLDALARVFPVLGDLDGAARPRPDDEIDRAAPHELRRRAFAALRELFARVAKGYRLVVHIDDLQWCDADSVQLLEALLQAPSPPWMLVCTYRSEPSASSAPLVELRRAIEQLGADCTFREIALGELGPGEAEELARNLVDSGDAADSARVTAEAGGHPLFLAELARWANEHRGSARGGGGLSLEQVILDRVAHLSDDARALLETLSVAGGPLTHAVAGRAAEMESRARTPALALRGARLVVTRGMSDGDSLETAHDRVRQAVTESLGDERRRACHGRIARALASESHRDPEAIFEHLLAAGDEVSARASVLGAAEHAGRSLAFLREAGLYREAIRLHAGPLEVLHRRLGDALANAERLADAADAYLAGAAHAPREDALELRRLAAEDYLKSGRTARGLAVLKAVLDEVDLAYPRSSERALVSLLWAEARLRVAPLRRTLRSAESVGAAELARIDVAFSAATGLVLSDPLRGANYVSRGLVLALEASEPLRLSRALALAASNVAMGGEGGRARAEELIRAAERIAAEIDEPRSRGFALLTAGTVHFFLGEWRAARSELERAEAIFRESCRAVAWEVANTQSWTCNVLILSGELREAARRVPPLMDEARGREDTFAMMHLVYPTCISRIVADDVEGAQAIVSVGSIGDPEVLTAGRWGTFISACSLDRYRGDGEAAWRRVEAESARLEGSMLWRSAMVRTFSSYERGLSALAAAAGNGREKRSALAAVDRWAKALGREKLRYAPALGALLRAGASAVRGDRADALEALDVAIPGLDRADLGYLAACARHRKGELAGGTYGRDLLDESTAFFAAQGIVRPDRCLAMSAPGF